MSESDDAQLTNVSKAHTLEEIAEFWDTHSLADYWDQTHENDVATQRQHQKLRAYQCE